ncbi:MBL fold metallo-hydrolase [Alcaligenes faecalis]|uniref:MBL fold metallo-hydrolase n=1 Tax=Alcaligenes aquatilis TaxID=323284 RepID=UPI000E90FEA1|nr:MBL fold metallo-hydrolase [Alcaligenes faecalis]HBQ89721.1 MBL fold metallo-hydrolase [Alcaligenes faecalis]
MIPIDIGKARIEKVIEIASMDLAEDWLFPNIQAKDIDAEIDWLDPSCIDKVSRKLKLSFHSFLIRTPSRNILIDTCNGNHKERPSMPAWHRLNTRYLDNLGRLGLRPEDIDLVLCTHLHADHVGWNTRLDNGRWVPTFPRARYLMGRQEFDHYHRLNLDNPTAPINRGSFVDSVLPIVEAGRAIFVDAGDQVMTELGTDVYVESAPGHTPGNLLVHICHGHEHAIMSGDVIHHPIQCARPHLSNAADFNEAAALRSRLNLLESCADNSKILLTGHFAGPTAGHVVSHGSAFQFKFLTADSPVA